MKFIKIWMIIVVAIIIPNYTNAQNLNWNSLEPNQKHIINLNIGYDYGFVYGISYGYKLKTKIPTVIDVAYSFPSGGKLIDDFKTKIGAQVQVLKYHDFQFNASIRGIYRRYENPFVRLQNFGSEITAQIGYYKPKWFLTTDIGFDKAIVTHFKHSNIFKNEFSEVKDGWYEPASGGNFSYGLQTGYSFKKNDLTLKIGQVINEDFKTKPLVPFYFQFGVNRRF